jgi:CRISPR-associated protein Csm4
MKLVVRATLHIETPLHLGEHGIGLEHTALFPHSDTLFSALCFAWKERFGEKSLEELLQQFLRGSPPFLISSAFPYYKEIRLYPKPYLRPRYSTTEGGAGPLLNPDAAERIKDVSWLSGSILHRWLAAQDLSSEARPENILGGIWLTKQESQELVEGHGGNPPWQREPVARVTLDRATSASNLYYVGQVRFAQKGGLFIYIASESEDTMQKVRLAIEHLGQIGLGGERSLGYGRFRIRSWDQVTWPRGGSTFVTLSLYHPTEEEVSMGILQKASYRLIRREGHITSPQWQGGKWRKWVYMLEEGSAISGDAASTHGDLVDVTPDFANTEAHRIYRYGFAFPLPIVEGDRLHDTYL